MFASLTTHLVGLVYWRQEQPTKRLLFFARWAGLFYIIFSMLGCHECWTNTTPISQDLSTTCNQPSVHFYPSKYFNSIQVILYGDTSKCSKLDEEKSWSTISEIWKVIMLTPSWPFLYFMFSSLSTVSSTDTWGVGETITQVSSSQYCVRPWQLLHPANAIWSM